MSNYKETEVVGSTWQRTNQIVIVNPVNSTPTVIYNEEQAINLGDRTITNSVGNLSVPCTDMEEVITLLNTETGEATEETITVGKLYQAIYSHYIKHALIRDTPVEEV